MRVAIEAQRIFRPDKHGMDYVILEVLRQLQQIDRENEYHVFVAPGKDVCLSSTPNMQVTELSCRGGYPVWEQIALPRAVKKCQADLLHCTSNTAPLHSPAPLLLTLHDIIYLGTNSLQGMSAYQKMGWLYRRWNVPRILQQCRQVITVSHTEAKNILQTFPSLEKRLKVVHNGYSHKYRPLSEKEKTQVLHKYALTDKAYLLFLGNTDPRKNLTGILQAYQAYLQQSSLPKRMVITGLPHPYVEEKLKSLQLSDCLPHLVFTGYVPGNDLPALYNGAFAFLFPSLNEGFGIPILEAMACGTPVITSNTSAMPEIAGKGAILIHPRHPQEISQALLRLETDCSYYQTQQTYGLRRAAQFSWKQTALEYLKIYQTACRHHSPNP